jgi:hypothetical protein
MANGLRTVVDPFAHTPIHSVPATSTAIPAALASALPEVPDVRVLARRDSAIFYFGGVTSAGDYRAYLIRNGVTFAGQQPRGAVIACAGFRQHGFESAVVNGAHTRELMQAVELPGLTAAGTYTVVLEAIATPCPFTGIPAHTDATITQGNFHAADPSAYPSTGQHYAKFASFDSVRAKYGNEIINGQGALSSWPDRMTSTMGLPAPAVDPVVIARSAFEVTTPPVEEAALAPVIDVNGIEDNFHGRSGRRPCDVCHEPRLLRRLGTGCSEVRYSRMAVLGALSAACGWSVGNR